MNSYESFTDTQLISHLQSGDQGAFTEVYRRFWDKIFAVAYHRLANQAEAEEIVQEVFLSLWKRRSNLQIKYTLNTYLSAATKYQVINKQSRGHFNKGEKKSLEEIVEQGIDTTELWFSERELRQELDKHINNLPLKCRLIFKMSRENYKSNAEIAEELNVSEKTVEAHITRALKILKDKLGVGLPLIVYLLSK
ncbi:RNA polymerase sigma-70 factor (ECF subfamily) [Pedobacter sp. AK013]|uniref:RNA polymerase sigma factor n=1 Tax=Pedobacter sp. AK013 TaxID=2723071 RepID=UPI0016086E63|nr:RNA polymerase sigma-70 factor [Pedobacter sp. AK013]MBB6237938.1 RNA polymerase sigma-70 factor (ECF subfamily) [Pedobacter sp. AK013]